jgi:hypothetical protein
MNAVGGTEEPLVAAVARRFLWAWGASACGCEPDAQSIAMQAAYSCQCFVGVSLASVVGTLAWHLPVRPVGPEPHRHSARREAHRSATERPHRHREVAELHVEGVGREIPGERRDAANRG